MPFTILGEPILLWEVFFWNVLVGAMLYNLVDGDSEAPKSHTHRSVISSRVLWVCLATRQLATTGQNHQDQEKYLSQSVGICGGPRQVPTLKIWGATYISDAVFSLNPKVSQKQNPKQCPQKCFKKCPKRCHKNSGQKSGWKRMKVDECWCYHPQLTPPLLPSRQPPPCGLLTIEDSEA